MTLTRVEILAKLAEREAARIALIERHGRCKSCDGEREIEIETYCVACDGSGYTGDGGTENDDCRVCNGYGVECSYEECADCNGTGAALR